MKYNEMTKVQLETEYKAVSDKYNALKAEKLTLDMSRGKPCKEQLDMGEELLSIVKTNEECYVDGVDIRNYGLLNGIEPCKKLFAELLEVKPEQVFVGGNASLALMYAVLTVAYIHGLRNSVKPWCKEEKVKILCPTPGYDRHFAMAQSFGAELVTVPLLDDGPDMDKVEELVKDSSVKAIWCVPKFSNPTGCVYSDEVIERLAKLKPAASDFTILYDNAYCVHEFKGEFIHIPEIIGLCEKYGNPDMVIEFVSTSKLTFPGAGVCACASSKENIDYLSSKWGYQTISYDKINQLRQVKYLKNREHVLEIMKIQGDILRPKFDAFIDAFNRELVGLDIADWTDPKGGYFISFNTLPGCAKRTVALMKEAGIVLTGAGSAYPYGIDPEDKNIRIAPSMPPLSDIVKASEAMCICVKLATLEKILEQ